METQGGTYLGLPWRIQVLIHRYAITVIILATCAACSSPAAPSEPRFSSEKLTEVRQQAELFASKGTGGVTVGIRSGDEIVLLEGFGSANEQLPLEPTTVLEVGSITKQFTAALVLLAEEEGMLSLDDELRTRLPEYPIAGAGITIRHLLGHTSGITSYTSLAAFNADPAREWSSEELVGLFSELPLEFEPGAGWSYSNSGYFLLGVILERVYQTSYDDLLELKLLEPLQMSRSGYCDRDLSTLERAQGYTGNQATPSVHMSGPGAAGALCSTAEDLLLWTYAHQKGEVVSADLSERAQLKDGVPTPYGFGLFVGRSNWRPSISHGGNIPGFTARTSHYILEGEIPLDLVLLSNRNAANLDVLEKSMLDVLVGPYEHAPPATTLSESAQAWLGTYRAIGLPSIAIEFDGQLYARFGAGAPRSALEQLAEVDFSYPAANLNLRFLPEQRSLEVEQGGAVLTLRAAE